MVQIQRQVPLLLWLRDQAGSILDGSGHERSPAVSWDALKLFTDKRLAPSRGVIGVWGFLFTTNRRAKRSSEGCIRPYVRVECRGR